MSLFEISAAVDDAVLCVGAEVKQLLLSLQRFISCVERSILCRNRSLLWVSFVG